MTEKNRWAIVDSKGVIEESNDEDEVRTHFEKSDFEWEGDLLLVEIWARKH